MNLKQGEDQLTDVTNYTIDKFYLTQVSFVFCPRRSNPKAMTTPEWPVSDVPGTRKYCRIKALITSHENHHAPHVSWTTRILTQYKQNYNIPTQGWSKVSTSRLCLYSKHPGDRSFRQSDCSEKENHDKSSFTWSVLSISMNPSKIRSLAAISGYDCPALSRTSGVHRFRLLAYWRRIACNKI